MDHQLGDRTMRKTNFSSIPMIPAAALKVHLRVPVFCADNPPWTPSTAFRPGGERTVIITIIPRLWFHRLLGAPHHPRIAMTAITTKTFALRNLITTGMKNIVSSANENTQLLGDVVRAAPRASVGIPSRKLWRSRIHVEAKPVYLGAWCIPVPSLSLDIPLRRKYVLSLHWTALLLGD